MAQFHFSADMDREEWNEFRDVSCKITKQWPGDALRDFIRAYNSDAKGIRIAALKKELAELQKEELP